MVWEHIAQTGEVLDVQDMAEGVSVAKDPPIRLGELRADFGASDELVNLTDSQMREMIASRHA